MTSVGKLNRKHLLAVFLFCLVLFLSSLITDITPSVKEDDISVYFGAVKLAGLEWTTVTKITDIYHGQAYYIMFTPLFIFIEDYLTRLFIILIINAFVLSGVGVLIYITAVKFFRLESNFYTAMLAVLIVRYTSCHIITGASNTLPVFMIVWIICLILMSLCNETVKKRRVVLSVALVAAFCYAMLIHARLIAVVIAVIVAAVIYYAITRKWVFEPVVFIPAMIVGLAVATLAVNYIVGGIFGGRSPDEVHNASILAELHLDQIPGVRVIADIIINNIYVLIIHTYGLGAIAVVLVIYLIIVAVKSARKRNLSGFLSDAGIPEDQFFILMVFGICIAGTILGLCTRYGTWLENMIEAGVRHKATEGLEYGRYYFPYFGPIMLVLYSFLLKRRDESTKFILAAFVVFITAFLYVYIFITPYAGGRDTIPGLFFIGDSIPITVGVVTFCLAAYAFCLRSGIDKLFYVLLFSVYLTIQLHSLSLPPSLRPLGGSGHDMYYALKGLRQETSLPHELYVGFGENFGIQYQHSHNLVIFDSPPEDTDYDCIFVCPNTMARKMPELYDEGFRRYVYSNTSVWLRGESLNEGMLRYAESENNLHNIITDEDRYFLESGGDPHELKNLSKGTMWVYQAMFPDIDFLGDVY